MFLEIIVLLIFT